MSQVVLLFAYIIFTILEVLPYAKTIIIDMFWQVLENQNFKDAFGRGFGFFLLRNHTIKNATDLLDIIKGTRS